MRKVASSNKDTIEINGELYDTRSGLPVVLDSDDAETTAQSPAVNELNQQAKPQIPKPAARPPRQSARHIKAHSAEPSRALNRKSVKKPTATQKPAIKLSHPASSSPARRPTTSLVRLSTATISPDRSLRAGRVKKSTAIKRFNTINAHNATNVPASTASGTSLSNALGKSPHPKTGRNFDITPLKSPVLAMAGTASSEVAISPPVPTSKFAAMVEKTERTNNHRYLEYTPTKSRRGLARLRLGQRRILAYGAIGLAIVLLAGFVFYEQKANIELQLADSRAGINASLPGYKPSGFSVGKFSYRPGLVAINYDSSEDGHYYKLIQSSSTLNSQALARQLAENGKYQTLHAAGQTVFTSRDGTAAEAAWVSGGILYQIKGNASLSQDQILKIATNT